MSVPHPLTAKQVAVLDALDRTWMAEVNGYLGNIHAAVEPPNYISYQAVSASLRRLRARGLVHMEMDVDGYVWTLTKRGWEVLDAHRKAIPEGDRG